MAFDDLDLLLTGVNRIRTAAGVTGAGLTWTDVMTPYNQATGQSVPIPQRGAVVYSGHLLALRQVMNDARVAAGVGAATYGVNVSPGQYITASAWTEIAGKAQ